jgi:hypothetical protein
MRLQDWLRDGLLGERARYRRAPQILPKRGEREEREDPSGRHDFGRRAHHPDPNAQYGFEPDANRRVKL